MFSLEELVIVLVFGLLLFAVIVIGGGFAIYALVRRATRDGVRDAARDAASTTQRE